MKTSGCKIFRGGETTLGVPVLLATDSQPQLFTWRWDYGNTQSQAAWDSGKPGLVEDAPARCRGVGLDDL